MDFNKAIKSFQDEISNITISVLNYIQTNPGTNGESIVQKMAEIYPQFSERDYFNDDIYFILDVLADNNFVYFDFVEDMWYLVDDSGEVAKIH